MIWRGIKWTALGIGFGINYIVYIELLRHWFGVAP